MRTKIIFFSLVVLFSMLLFISGCKTDESSWCLNVSVSEGVVGTPETGTYQYDDVFEVEYSYSLAPGYKNLVVIYNTLLQPSSGTIKPWNDDNNTLTATAELAFDVRGRWTGEHNFLAVDFFLEVTFSGDRLTGSTYGFTDQMDGMNGGGTFTVSEDETTITFSLQFYNRTYHFQGTVENHNRMIGTYYTVPTQWSGNWELNRQQN